MNIVNVYSRCVKGKSPNFRENTVFCPIWCAKHCTFAWVKKRERKEAQEKGGTAQKSTLTKKERI